MDIQELDKIKMGVMNEIANGNLKVAGMKADLKKLLADKEDFFKLRENELLGRINTLFNDSKHLLDETKANYSLVHEYYVTLTQFSEWLKQGQLEFEEVVEDFKVQSVEVQRELDAKIEHVSRIRKIMADEKAGIEKDRAFINSQKQSLAKEKVQFAQQLNELRIAMQALKRK